MTIIVILVIVGVFVYGQYRYCLYNWDKNLKINVRFSKDLVGALEKFDIIESISNKKRLPLPIFRLKYQTGRDLVAIALRKDKTKNSSDKFYYTDSMSVHGYEEMTKNLECLCKTRGIYTIDKLFVTTYDLMMINSFYDVYDVSASILVYPSRVDYEKLNYSYNQLNGDILSRLHYLEDPFEFKGIRDYTPGDGIRKINYKASAKSQDLMVNVYDQTITRSVCIVSDVSNNYNFSSKDLLEESLCLAKTIAEDLLNEGYEVSYISNGLDFFHNEEICVHAGSGIKHLSAIHEGMAVIDLNLEAKDLDIYEILHNNFDSNIFYIVISSNQTEDMFDSFRNMINNNNSFMWIVPTGRRTEFKIPTDLIDYAKEWNDYGNK